jgi:hypothetical protein
VVLPLQFRFHRLRSPSSATSARPSAAPLSAGATASLALGAYSLQIYSKSPRRKAAVAFDPPAPDGCGTTVRITYTPGEGPLDTAAPVYAFIGRNGWQNSANHLMTADGDIWTLDYDIPDLTYELNVSFTDGADAWDNNGGLNWAVPVSNCGDLPSEAVWSPYLPQGCVPLPITYRPNGGPLMGADNVTLFIGRNSWNHIVEIPMTQMSENEWTLLYSIPDDTWELNFVFFTQAEGGRIWDNNNTRNWRAASAAA